MLSRTQNCAREDFALAFYESKYKPTLRQVGLCLKRGGVGTPPGYGALSVERTRQLVWRAREREREGE